MATANFTKSYSQKAPAMIKIESSYKASTTPAAATDDILLYNSSIVAVPDATAIESNPHIATFSRSRATEFCEKLVRCRFTARLQTSGTDGSETVNGYAGLDAALRSCAMAQSTDVNSIDYAPVAIGSEESCTMWVDHDGVLFKVDGMRGNVVISARTSSFIECNFDMIGHYNDPTGTGSEFSSWTGGTDRSKPWCGITWTQNNGGSNDSPVIKSWSFDTGVSIERLVNGNDSNGIDEFFVGNRRPTCSITFAKNTHASANIQPETYITDWLNNAADYGLSLTVSSGTNQLVWTATEAQIRRLSEVPGQAQRDYQVNFDLLGLTGGAGAEGEWDLVVGTNA